MHVSGALHERYAPRSVHPVHPMAHHHHIYPEPAFVDTDSVLHVSGVAGARVAHSADVTPAVPGTARLTVDTLTVKQLPFTAAASLARHMTSRRMQKLIVIHFFPGDKRVLAHCKLRKRRGVLCDADGRALPGIQSGL